jgi:hypothetical protein
MLESPTALFLPVEAELHPFVLSVMLTDAKQLLTFELLQKFA